MTFTAGKLRRVWDEKTVEATCGPEGWSSPDSALMRSLEVTHPSGGTVSGAPWVAAFWAAARDLGAEVVTAPAPDAAGGDLEDVPPAGTARSAHLLAAHEALLADVLARMVRRVGTHARRATADPAKYMAFLERVQAEHRPAVEGSLRSALAAAGAVLGRDLDAGAEAEALLAHLGARLGEVADTATPARLAGEVERVLAEAEAGWPGQRAREILGGG